MKSISTLLLLVSVSFIGLNAQKPITVSDDSLTYGKSPMPGISVTIPEVKYETVLKSWTRELQSGTKSKLVTENNTMSIFGAKIKDLSPTPLNVYSKMMALDSMVKLTVVFELKKDQYIDHSTSETDLQKAKNYLKQFAKAEYLDLAKDQEDAEDKKLRDLQRDLSSLEKDKSRLQKDIESANSTIYSENQNLAIQKNELESVSAEIVEQNKQLSTPQADAVKKEKTDYLSGLEKRKKKALNSMESSQAKINKANNEIDKANAEIPKNEKMQDQVNNKISAQQAVYQKYADKTKAIKAY
jgi:peptidoglycan hydrolase CwlO-like protein